MSWTLEPFIGDAGNLDDHEFDVVVGETAVSINDREQEIIDAVKAGIDLIALATGGHISISAYGSQAQIPSPGDTTVLYITYVPDPSSGASIVAQEPSVVGDGGDGMSTQQALNEQEAEASQTSEPGDQEGLSVGPTPAISSEPVEPDGGESIAEPVAVIDPADPSTPSQGQPDVPVTPSVPPQLAVPPTAPPVDDLVDPNAGTLGAVPRVDPTVPIPSSPPPDPVIPPSAPTAPVADTPATPSADPTAVDPLVPLSDAAAPPVVTPDPAAASVPAPIDTSPQAPAPVAQPAPAPQVIQQSAGQEQSLETGAGVGPDEAANRVAAQIAENPVEPTPLYWVDPGTTIDATKYPQADVLAANGALLYNYVSDQPGGSPTGAPDGGPWHVYEGATQPAPGTPAATIAAAQQGAPTPVASAADTTPTTAPTDPTPSA